MTNGASVYPIPACVNSILSIENTPPFDVVIATAVASALPDPNGAVEIATFGVLVYPLPSSFNIISRI